MEKEGVQSAIDFIKYILAVAGGAIVFVIQPSFYETSLTIRVLSSFGVALLTLSIIAGIAAHSAGSVMLSKGATVLAGSADERQRSSRR
jgi:hypothetical protein